MTWHIYQRDIIQEWGDILDRSMANVLSDIEATWHNPATVRESWT